ncbi:hypothetical protein QJS10_CPB22g00350 [Acorus calamus]|uniref:Protein FAR1-RELATED SEQUENCE n=1 Tax=Acorus calamus TaxID=4465 RepID=A0AAV9C3I1_ACOCL|nr:hypothetical protein QJS10_CPB22g00350 [Acorus calamus]
MDLCGGDEIHTTDANVIVEDEENGDTELKAGMEFKSINEAFESYKEYAFRCEFGIIKTGRKYIVEGDLKAVIFACSKEGPVITSGSHATEGTQPSPPLKTLMA